MLSIFRVLVATFVANNFFSTANCAELSVLFARVENGAVIVAGTGSGPAKQISAPEFSTTTTTDQHGNFLLVLRTLPETCILRVGDEQSSVTAIVAGCAPRGPVGQNGADGVSGYERVRQECEKAQLIDGFCKAPCPSGKKLFGGSCSGNGSLSDRSGAHPHSDEWRCFGGGATGKLTALAICGAIAQ